MTKVEFLKQCTTFFSRKKFSCRNNHYYKEVSSDVLIVFGIQMSRYGGYCYLEYGYCFKSINKYLPYPKFTVKLLIFLANSAENTSLKNSSEFFSFTQVRL